MIDPVDLLIKNGDVYAQEGLISASVGITDGIITYLGAPEEAPTAREEIDAKGCIVAPGLVDLHTHVLVGSARLGVNSDKTAATSGVTTWVDAGTAGAGTFEGLLMHVRDRVRSRIIPFINMSYIGLTPAGMLTREIGELWDPAFADLRALLRVEEEFPGEIRGIKVRASSNAIGDNAASILPQAREAANILEVPLMFHVGMSPPTLAEALPFLIEGDILTHCFHPHAGGRILGVNDVVKPEVREAQARGVLLDVGHGVASMSHKVAIEALSQGVIPESLSSDIHAENIGGPIKSMLTVMDLFLALGMSVTDVLARSTSKPAAAAGRTDLGVLVQGNAADIAILRIESGSWEKQDSTGHLIDIARRFIHVRTIIDGKLIEPFDDGRDEFRESPWLSRFGAQGSPGRL